MSSPISVRLDDTTRKLLEREARERSMGLSALLREIATDAAKEVRRRRIRRQTKAVAEYIAGNSDAQELVEFWSTPRTELPE